MATINGWRSVVKNTGHMAPNATEALDAAETLVAFPNKGDNAARMSTWLRDLRTQGLLTGPEVFCLRAAIAVNL